MIEYRLGDHGKALSTRPLGSRLREEVLAAARSDETVALDFANVLSVSYSFADEFAGRLVEDEAAGTVEAIEIRNARAEVSRILDRAIGRRRDALAAA